MECLPQLKQSIMDAAADVCGSLQGVDYVEANFRTLLTRALRVRGHTVYEEVVIPYVLLPDEAIPIGHGFADIVIIVPRGAVILELKASRKNCQRQLSKYLRHWTYCPVYFGATVNFVADTVHVDYVEV
jgi:hypothetical protein